MDSVARLIFAFLVAAILCAWSSPSHGWGAVAAQSRKQYSCQYGGQMFRGFDPTSVAQNCISPKQTYNWGSATYTAENCKLDPQPAVCDIMQDIQYVQPPSPGKSFGGYIYLEWVIIHGSCPANSTGQGQECGCDFGFSPKNGACEQYTCPPSGGYSAVTQPDQKVANAGDSLCTAGCGYKPSSWKVGQDGQIWATWPFKSTGSFCAGDKDPAKPTVDTGEKNTKNPAPVPCGQNQCPGQVNGATICVPCKGTTEQGPSTSASGPSSGASGPGNSSSDTSTTCNGITCTTTTTTRDGSGAITGQIEKNEGQESFCKQNPESNLCKQSSFGGACASTTCNGDAIQCAIAAEQYKRNCEWFENPKARSWADRAEAAMSNESQPEGHPRRDAQAQDIAFGSTIDQTDRLGSTCPVDVSFSVNNAQWVLPFSQMCDKLRLVGNLMVGFMMLVCALIVFRN